MFLYPGLTSDIPWFDSNHCSHITLLMMIGSKPDRSIIPIIIWHTHLNLSHPEISVCIDLFHCIKFLLHITYNITICFLPIYMKTEIRIIKIMIYSMHVTRIRQNTRPHKSFIMTVHPAYATKEIELRNRIHCGALLFQETVTRNDSINHWWRQEIIWMHYTYITCKIEWHITLHK